jgi:beta-ribofuranosylaminobenzene 5'-phosphate synthase
MMRVRTASRLHFGLLSFASPETLAARWPDVQGQPALPARHFGGVGLMVEAPGIEVGVEPAAAWSAEGCLAERALAFARQFVRSLSLEQAEPPRPHRLVAGGAAEHLGLGTGTQLGLAVARALAAAYGLGDLGAIDLARRVGRGKRSALGIHGFAHGGFLVEAGKRLPDEVAPLVARAAFPEAWRLVLVLPAWGQGLHGNHESQAFQRLLARSDREVTDALCRLTLLGMLPALAERDLEAFGEAVYDFNRRVGEVFQPVQGGTYAHPRTAEVIGWLRQQGVHGVGQSSWGPAVFAVVEDELRAGALATRLGERFSFAAREVVVTRAANHGAIVI